jgi:subtilisin family serine protease
MKKMVTLLLASVVSLMLTGQNFRIIDPVTTDLRLEMAEASANDLIRINIRMKDQFNAFEFISRSNNMTREEVRQQLVSELKSFTHEKQKQILSELNYYSRSGAISEVKALWIANVINCYATPEVIEQLATRHDVERIDHDEERILLYPFSVEEAKDEGTREITYNVLKVNAPDVWALGFTGEGIVVAVLDTGVNYNHNDLSNNMWTHPDFPYHGWNFTNNTNNPMDFHGHGTHCAGTVAGDGTSGSQTGIAPGAKIMALQVLTSSGGGTESGVWDAIEFGVEHGANVLSLSLGWQHSWGPDRASWRNTMDNALAAGVVAAVAAGNEGDQQGSYPIPDNVRTPGDCPPPWLHPDQTLIGGTSAVITIGATNSSDNLAGFSSRGPVTWQNIAGFTDYPYNPGIGLIRPDIVAPGVSVKSTSHSNPSGYTNMSGTSMACPAAAGVMALVLSKNPALLPEQLAQTLEETALVLTPGKNNNTGSGRVDALAAFNATSFPGPVYLSHEFNDEAGNNDGNINPSEFIEISIALFNNTEEVYENVEATVFTDSPYITMVDSVLMYGNFQPGDTITIEDGFSFEVADDIPGAHEIQFFVITGDGIESWESSFKENANAPILGAGSMVVFDPEGNGNGILDPGEDANIQIPTLNTGQMDADDVMVTFTTDNPYITITTTQLDLGTILAGGIQTAIFPISVDPSTPLGENLVFNYTIVSGFYTYERSFTHKVGMMLEDFETGDFSKYNWAFGGNLPFTITNVNPFEGQYSAKSGAIGNNQVSRMQLTMNVADHDSISFYFKVSSEDNYDYFKFFIGSEMIDEWAGEVPWQRKAYAVTPGSKTFRWEYVKDASVANGSDCAWLDYITLPQPLITTAYAGADVLLCEGETVQLDGHAMNYTSIMWHTSGTGTFSNPAILNPVYTPSQEDIDMGGVLLTLSVSNPSNDQISDQLTLTIQQAVHVFAGEDMVICANNEYFTESAEAANHSGLFWESSGTGYFADPAALHTTYTPSEDDLAAGSVSLTLHGTGASPCGDDASAFMLSFTQPVMLTLDDEIHLCGDGGVAELNAIAENYSQVLWTSAGTGSFDDPGILNPVYTPSADDLNAGSVELSIELSGIGPCENVGENISLIFVDMPTAEITGDATICEGESATIDFVLTGEAPWTVVVANMDDIVITESPYQITITPYSSIMYEFLAVIDGNGCEITEAGQVSVTVNPLPLVPEKPAGVDTVDFAYNMNSVFTTEAASFATDYVWEFSPSEAGTVSSNGTELTVDWSSDFIGEVTIKVKSLNDCGESDFSEEMEVYLKNTTGIANLGKLGAIRIFPNPSEGFFTLEMKSVKDQMLNIRIYNLLGRAVESFEYTAGSGTSSLPLDLRNLPDGLYMLQIEHQDGVLSSKLIISK